MHINAESQLRFPVTFSDKERTVRLTGEAYFEVSHRENTPFVVEVGNMRVRQYGTKFNINAYNEAPEVVLVAGSIGVSGDGGEEAYIATVDQIIKRRLSVHCFLQIFIPSMSIAYDQYLHFMHL